VGTALAGAALDAARRFSTGRFRSKESRNSNPEYGLFAPPTPTNTTLHAISSAVFLFVAVIRSSVCKPAELSANPAALFTTWW
jgi:hypothetical protein